MPRDLPEFENPPVIEVVLSIQFEPLVKLTNAHLGLLWAKYKDRYPKTQSFAPIEPVIEKFGILPPPQEVRVQLMQTPVLRSWFKDEAETLLIQVQQDRFLYNWIKGPKADEYPRYRFVRERFEEEFSIFQGFINREELGEIIPNQCEVTYVNNIYGEGVWKDYSEVDKIFTVFEPQYSDTFLRAPEHINFGIEYIIRNGDGNPIGRLHMLAEPRYRREDKQPLYALTLIARGFVQDSGLQGASAFFDIGHEWVVKGFKSITRPEMHKAWRLKDDS